MTAQSDLMYSLAAVCYLAVSLSLSLLIRRLQKKMSTAQAREASII